MEQASRDPHKVKMPLNYGSVIYSDLSVPMSSPRHQKVALKIRISSHFAEPHFSYSLTVKRTKNSDEDIPVIGTKS